MEISKDLIADIKAIPNSEDDIIFVEFGIMPSDTEIEEISDSLKALKEKHDIKNPIIFVSDGMFIKHAKWANR